MTFLDFITSVNERSNNNLADFPISFAHKKEDKRTRINADNVDAQEFFTEGWFSVGENASHVFYIREGKSNNFFRAAIEFMPRKICISLSSHPIEDLGVVYLGHF